jgi:predicted Fe-Mo cluster-binding NifX family protein
MKIALTIFNERIAPVFDVACRLMVLEIENGRVIKETMMTLPDKSLDEKIILLRQSGIKQLICGAISCQAQAELEQYGIKTYAFIAGDRREIITAWLNKQLEKGEFAMPGCGKRRKCCRRRNQI